MSATFSTLIPIIVSIAFFVGFFYLIVWLVKWGVQKRNKDFQDLAFSLGMEYYPPAKVKWYQESYPIIEGMLLERHVKISMFSRGSGKSKTYHYFISMVCGVQRQSFGISKEGFFNKIGKFFGGQDIQLNDEAFDDKFMIKGEDEIFVKRLLDGNLKHYFKQNRSKISGKIELRPNEVYYEEVFTQSTKVIKEKARDIMFLMQKIAERAEYLELGE